jgi:alkylation response protein AidB-like acyl-CoA dehydrogenase
MNVPTNFAQVLDGSQLALSDEERELYRQTRELAERVLLPQAAAYDRENRFPRESFDALGKAGLLALLVPRELGGKGVSQLAYAAIVTEIAKADAALALCFTMHSTSVVFLRHLASPAQQQKFFDLVTREQALFSALGSEPDANLFSGRLPSTLLERVSGGYRLRGKKSWCSLGGNANWSFVNATLDETVVAAMVPLHQPGVLVRQDWDTLSMRGTQSVSIDFEDVFIPEIDVIEKPMNLFLELEYGVGLCASYLGLAAATYREARQLAAQSVRRLLSFEVGHGHPDVGRLFATIGEMRIALEPAWLMLQRAATTGEVGTYQRAWALAEAKHVVGETAAKIASQALRVAGAKALSKRHPIERLFRDAQAGLVMAIKPENAAYIAGRFELGVLPSGLSIAENPSGYAVGPEVLSAFEPRG